MEGGREIDSERERERESQGQREKGRGRGRDGEKWNGIEERQRQSSLIVRG